MAPRLANLPDTYEGDDYFSDVSKPAKGESERLRGEIRSLRQRNDALQRQIRDVAKAMLSVIVEEDPRFIEQAKRIRELEEELNRYRGAAHTTIEELKNEPVNDELMDETADSDPDLSNLSPEERLAAHLNYVPSLPLVPLPAVHICAPSKGPKMKVFKKWATPSRLWITEDYMIHRRYYETGRAVVMIPSQIPATPTGDETQPYKLDTAPFDLKDTREVVNLQEGKWYYLGTYKIVSADTLSIEDAESLIKIPQTLDLTRTFTHDFVTKVYRSRMRSMLEEGTARVNVIALTRVGSKQELIKFGTTNPYEQKKEDVKKTERVRRMLISNGHGGSPKVAPKIALSKHPKFKAPVKQEVVKQEVVKQEFEGWN